MARVSRKSIYGTAAAIWIEIKLPQEYWIHIAQRDVADTLADNPKLAPILGMFIALVVGFAYWMVTRRMRPADQTPSFAVRNPIPESRVKEAMLRFRSIPLRDQGLLEKVVLIALLNLNFSQILPITALTTLQLVIGIGLIVILNAVISEPFARRG